MTMFEHANQSEQLKMFMTPREIMENYSFHDAARNITAVAMGNLDTVSWEPTYLDNLPQKFGLPAPFEDPRTVPDDNLSGWHAAKAKFERGEGNDPDAGDYYYEAGALEPGTREYAETHDDYDENLTVRENYLNSWMDVEGTKGEMESRGFTGDIDEYLDDQKWEHDKRMEAAQEYQLEDVTDRSTWFEDDKQVVDRALVDAQSPTNEVLLAQEYLENPDSDSAGFGTPFGAGAYERVAVRGVEKPILLGTNLEVNVRGDIKRPILGDMHDLVSAYKQKPDTLLPVEHSQYQSHNSVQRRLFPHEERWGEVVGGDPLWEIEALNDERARINVASHLDSAAGRLVDDETLEKEFYTTRPGSASQLEAFGNKP